LTPEFLALWLGLSLFTSASIAELVRAGAEAVPAGQWNAALALGMTRGQAIAGAIFPQALRLAIPPLASQYMNLIKNSSLAVVIGYPDLVSIGNTSINQNGQALEVIVIVMAVYLTMNLVVAVIMNAVNRRVTRAPR
jgi:general L-amino acid transport system permease protein